MGCVVMEASADLITLLVMLGRVVSTEVNCQKELGNPTVGIILRQELAKFDHPLTGHSYNNGLNFPTLPVFDPTVFACQRNLLTVPSLDQSPPKLTSISEWVMKPEAEVDENPKLDTETPENASEHAVSPPIPLPDSSQLSDEQSD